jgi:hypothetical protein
LKTDMKDPGLATVDALGKLNAVYLMGTKPDDAAMALFAVWENVRLTILNLKGTRIADAVLGRPPRLVPAQAFDCELHARHRGRRRRVEDGAAGLAR